MDNTSFSPEQINAMIQMLQGMLASNPEQKTSELDVSQQEKKKEKRPNMFDTMNEKNMHKADTAIDKKLNVQPPVPRARPYNTVDVTCRVCGKKETINSVLLSEKNTERYKCNKCSISPG